jgi:hypothetical protein
MTEFDELEPIDNIETLEDVLAKGYELVGPRKTQEKDKAAMERFFKKGHVFFPEVCLTGQGCTLVEPSPLTKNLKFAYRCEGEDMYRWHKSQYYLKKGDEEIWLYLKSPEGH